MANPQKIEMDSLHPTLDSDFRDKQYDRKNIFASNTNAQPSAFGVQNSQKVVRMSDHAPNVKKRERLPQIKSFTNEEWSRGDSFEDIPTPANQPGTKIPADSKKNESHIIGSKGWATFRGVSLGITNLGWTGFLWIYVQIPFVVLNLMTLGLWTQSEIEKTTFLGKVADKALDLVYWTVDRIAAFIAGIDTDILEFSSVFIISWSVVFAVGVVSIAIVVLSYSLALLHPLSGKGAGIKYSLLCLCLLGYAIPGLNLLPWIWFYIFSVMRYPK